MPNRPLDSTTRPSDATDVQDEVRLIKVTIRTLIQRAYDAIEDATDTGEQIDFETTGRPLADALALLRGAG